MRLPMSAMRPGIDTRARPGNPRQALCESARRRANARQMSEPEHGTRRDQSGKSSLTNMHRVLPSSRRNTASAVFPAAHPRRTSNEPRRVNAPAGRRGRNPAWAETMCRNQGNSDEDNHPSRCRIVRPDGERHGSNAPRLDPGHQAFQSRAGTRYRNRTGEGPQPDEQTVAAKPRQGLLVVSRRAGNVRVNAAWQSLNPRRVVALMTAALSAWQFRRRTPELLRPQAPLEGQL